MKNMEETVFCGNQMCVGYSGRPLIRDLNLRVHRGELVCLMGPNGAGKSTVLKTVTGQIPLLEGTMELRGRDLVSMKEQERARLVSVVLTERIRPELMTCREVVEMGRYPYTGRLGLLGREDRLQVEAAMELTDSRQLGELQFSQVSDGQQQRVLLARAICQEPELIVLDEPASFLDIRYKLEIMTVLKRLAAERGTGVLMSVHELDLIRSAADHVICLKEGRVFAGGTPGELFTEELIAELYDIRMESYDPCFEDYRFF